MRRRCVLLCHCMNRWVDHVWMNFPPLHPSPILGHTSIRYISPLFSLPPPGEPVLSECCTGEIYFECIANYHPLKQTDLQGPIALSRNAPMELVFELFSKLGLRYLCIVDGGRYIGVVHKKMFLAYLRSLEND